jgi:hypothetical protein
MILAEKQLRWSWGVKLLSQADDEAPDVETVPNPILAVQSPEALEPHPGARETDPFFTTARSLTQDEADERRNPSGSFKRSSSPSWVPDQSSARSVHPLHQPTKRDSASSSGVVRRGSGSVPPMRRVPTRTESGREFWGLPEAPRRQRIMLPEDVQEDGSDYEEEWVSHVLA